MQPDRPRRGAAPLRDRVRSEHLSAPFHVADASACNRCPPERGLVCHQRGSNDEFNPLLEPSRTNTPPAIIPPSRKMRNASDEERRAEAEVGEAAASRANAAQALKESSAKGLPAAMAVARQATERSEACVERAARDAVARATTTDAAASETACGVTGSKSATIEAAPSGAIPTSSAACEAAARKAAHVGAIVLAPAIHTQVALPPPSVALPGNSRHDRSAALPTSAGSAHPQVQPGVGASMPEPPVDTRPRAIDAAAPPRACPAAAADDSAPARQPRDASVTDTDGISAAANVSDAHGCADEQRAHKASRSYTPDLLYDPDATPGQSAGHRADSRRQCCGGLQQMRRSASNSESQEHSAAWSPTTTELLRDESPSAPAFGTGVTSRESDAHHHTSQATSITQSN